MSPHAGAARKLLVTRTVLHGGEREEGCEHGHARRGFTHVEYGGRYILHRQEKYPVRTFTLFLALRLDTLETGFFKVMPTTVFLLFPFSVYSPSIVPTLVYLLESLSTSLNK